MEGLSEGKIVHFVLHNSKFDFEGKKETIVEEVICRPAIIVNAWGGKLEDGMINLQVFLDGSNDNNYVETLRQGRILAEVPLQMTSVFNVPAALWMTSVKYSETKETGTWHWPERS